MSVHATGILTYITVNTRVGERRAKGAFVQRGSSMIFQS